MDRFHDEVRELKAEVREMAATASRMLRKGVRAYRKSDLALVEEVAALKGPLHEMDVRIEEHALRIFALYQPMAKDMRAIAVALKMNTHLYRIGRYGYDIARLMRADPSTPHHAELVSIPHMAETVVGMVRDIVDAYDTDDVDLDPASFEERDQEVDALRYSIMRECLTYMMEKPSTIPRSMEYIMVARYLERCGDHSCKLAEKVYYMRTGEHIEID